MKKSPVLSTVTAALLLMGLLAATACNNSQPETEHPQSDVQSNMESSVESTPENNTNDPIQPQFTSPDQAYEAFIKGEISAKGKEEIKVSDLIDDNLNSGIYEYAFLDINHDGTHELITHSQTIDIFTFTNSGLLHLYKTPEGRDIEEFVLENGAIFSKHSSTGVSYTYTTVSANLDVSTVAFDCPPDGFDSYYFDGLNVTKEEWETQTKEYFAAAEKKADLQWIEYSLGDTKNFKLVPYITTNVKPDQVWHFSEDIAVVSIDSDFRMVNLYGDYVGEEYDLITSFKNGVAYAQTKDGESVYLDTNGNRVENPSVDDDIAEADGSSTEIYKETVNGAELYGLKDFNGNKKTEPLFEYIIDDKAGYYFAVFNSDAKPVFIDNNGKLLNYLPDGVIDADKTNSNKNIVAYYGENKHRLLNAQGEVLNETPYSYIGDFEDNIAIIQYGHKLGLIDFNGKVVAEPSLSAIDCGPSICNGKIAYIDENGFLSFADIIDE